MQLICSFLELETLAFSFVGAHDLKGNVDHFHLPVELKTVTLRHYQCEAGCLHFVRRVAFRDRVHPTAYQFYIRQIQSSAYRTTFQAVSEARKLSSVPKAYF